MLELIGKAMNGTIREQDIDLSLLKPLLVDCAVPKTSSFVKRIQGRDGRIKRAGNRRGGHPVQDGKQAYLDVD